MSDIIVSDECVHEDNSCKHTMKAYPLELLTMPPGGCFDEVNDLK